ncbi:hypothetical protein AGMMS49959_10200 [Planctomycetales bacterium]|nr:hypothetical protein AGMMS49959_10200 [Planctomycetales bacterium]
MTLKRTIAWFNCRRKRIADLFEKVGAGALLLGIFGGDYSALFGSLFFVAGCLSIDEHGEEK